MSTAASVCFIAYHKEASNHFIDYAQAIIETDKTVVWLAYGAALKKASKSFDTENFNPSNLNLYENQKEQRQLAQTIAKKADSIGRVIITECRHPFMGLILEALKNLGTERTVLVYYDGYENRLPGLVPSVIQLADGLLFPTKRLLGEKLVNELVEPIDTSLKMRIATNYYPLLQIEGLKKEREEKKSAIRKGFFEGLNEKDKGQSIYLYFGGYDTHYFEIDFVNFLEICFENAVEKADWSNCIILLHRHKLAQEQNFNKDLEKLQEKSMKTQGPRFVWSEMSRTKAQIMADAVLYSQQGNSDVLDCALADIPIIQVNSQIKQDLLVQAKVCQVAMNQSELIQQMMNLRAPSQLRKDAQAGLLNEIGYNAKWTATFKQILSIC